MPSTLLAVGGAAVLGLACSQAPPPRAEPLAAAEVSPPAEESQVLEPLAAEPETQSERKPEAAPVATTEVAEGAPPPPAVERADPTVILIERGERAADPRTLWEAAVAAREQRSRGERTQRISIRNDNLHEFQDGELTIASPREPAAAPAGAEDPAEESAGATATGAAGAAEATVHGEEYWRSTVLDVRQRLRAAVDELDELEGRAAELRRSFYAQDDPYVRDADVKPAWDRTLDRIRATRRRILDLFRELEDTLEEGRRAGALPGWLREGIALEPAAEELPRPRDDVYEPREPTVMEIGDEEPPSRR